MRHAVRFAATVISCAVIATVAPGIPSAAAPPGQADVRAAMDQAVETGTPGVIAAVVDHTGRWSAGSGVGDVHTGREPRQRGRFRIASVSKTFTATLVLQLVQEGRIGLDDPVAGHLPGLLPYPEPITVRQLLQHTSGLPRDLPPELGWQSLPEVDTERFVSLTPEQVVRSATADTPLRFEPGTSWAYSNIGYTVLAMLVEKITKQPIEVALADRILRPLRLFDTELVRDQPLLTRAAGHGYEQLYQPPRGLTDVTVYNYSRYFGSGSMVSTTTDVNRFFRALLRGRLLSADTLAQMKQTVPALDGNGEYAGFDYGLGLARLPLPPCGEGTFVWGHDGSLPGFGTYSLHDESASTQITTVGTRNITAPIDSLVARFQVAAAAFCELETTTTARTTRLATTLPRLLALGPMNGR
ncbi:penicillin-binding protein, beta-lactamase class C [Saccharomonospora marina XMU15]|uniref:Penicillin-binding protein, beta-lactamase class C n=1 Tax=Saccharomonospora marina XMU15 TaxID=882083 RepID=H5X8A9_9PSEU|nr:serine hydrolase domain-containing protein [Saccharomonospora marina]EHR49140.1 penicillin-binding protein, beta-lactamase class C [Saccharomonospora marina XMU15]